MKKAFSKEMMLLLFGLVFALCTNAVPAKRGMWRTIKLKNGKKVSVELRGDEHGHFLADRNGNAYSLNSDGTYDMTTVDIAVNGEEGSVKRNAKAQLRQMEIEKARKSPRKAQGIPEDKSKFLGRKKGLVILAQYKDVKFSTTTPEQFDCSSINELYNKIINTRNLAMEPFYGSVKDYFLEQSDEKFELDFDVVGPVTLDNNRAFYGGGLYRKRANGSNNRYEAVDDEDILAGYMVYEALQKAKGSYGINFNDYDWDGDKECEVVYVLYAGQGAADGGDEWTVWPHKYSLASGASNLIYYRNVVNNSSTYNYYYKSGSNSYTQISSLPSFSAPDVDNSAFDNVKIDVYACSNELATNRTYNSSTESYTFHGTQLNGIGTICHEFSHTMGYPDMYDIAYINYGMDHWDLMNSGSYNGYWNGGNSDWEWVDAGYRPCGYTAFERWCAGWIEPIELTDPQKITQMKPLGGTRNGAKDHGEAYVVYMPNSTKSIKGEYYLLENRERINWDYDLPWFGLLINYVHYNESLWTSNCLNCTDRTTLSQRNASNSHQRMTVFQACGSDPGYLCLDTYPYNINYLPLILEGWGTTGEEVANNLNQNFGTNGLALNTSSNFALTNTSNPSAYYYGTGTSKKKLTDHDIWDIKTTGDDDRTVNFIYRRSANNVLNLDQDATTSPVIEKGLYTSVTTNKPLTDGTFNTLWFPFNMSASEISSYLGENAQVYRLKDIRAKSNGSYDVEIIEDTKNGIKAYEPVFVKVDGGSEGININYNMQVDKTLAEVEPVVELENGWKMVGTTTYGTIPDGYYFIGTSNGVQKFYRSKGTSKLRAYRAYFVAPASEAETETASSANLSYVLFDKEEVNDASEDKAIQPIDFDERLFIVMGPDEVPEVDSVSPMTFKVVGHNDNGDIYNMNGQKVGDAHTGNRLPKGVYISNNKKFVIE